MTRTITTMQQDQQRTTLAALARRYHPDLVQPTTKEPTVEHVANNTRPLCVRVQLLAPNERHHGDEDRACRHKDPDEHDRSPEAVPSAQLRAHHLNLLHGPRPHPGSGVI